MTVLRDRVLKFVARKVKVRNTFTLDDIRDAVNGSTAKFTDDSIIKMVKCFVDQGYFKAKNYKTYTRNKMRMFEYVTPTPAATVVKRARKTASSKVPTTFVLKVSTDGRAAINSKLFDDAKIRTKNIVLKKDRQTLRIGGIGVRSITGKDVTFNRPTKVFRVPRKQLEKIGASAGGYIGVKIKKGILSISKQ